jgi:hypothetical protein
LNGISILKISGLDGTFPEEIVEFKKLYKSLFKNKKMIDIICKDQIIVTVYLIFF